MRPSLVKILPARPLTLGELYVMVMALAPIVPDSVAGGLFGGPCSATVAGGIAGGVCGATAAGGVAGGVGGGVCWANRVAAAMKRPVQTKRRFMVIFLLWAETLLLVGRLQRGDCRTLRPVAARESNGRWPIGWTTSLRARHCLAAALH